MKMAESRNRIQNSKQTEKDRAGGGIKRERKK